MLLDALSIQLSLTKMRVLLLATVVLTLFSCKEEVKLKYENTVVVDSRSDSIPAVLIGLHEMSGINVMRLENVLHELVDDTPIEARVVALIKTIDSKKGVVSIYSKTGEIFTFNSLDQFPIKGNWDNQMAIFESKVTKDKSKQGFKLEFTSMLVLNQQIHE